MKCKNCLSDIKSSDAYCPYCGTKIHKTINLNETEFNKFTTTNNDKPLNLNRRKIAGILALLLGTLGVHKFYLGKFVDGIIYLALSFSIVPSILGFFDAIKLFRMSDEEFEMLYPKKY